jgi:hypothetical protein
MTAYSSASPQRAIENVAVAGAPLHLDEVCPASVCARFTLPRLFEIDGDYVHKEREGEEPNNNAVHLIS